MPRKSPVCIGKTDLVLTKFSQKLAEYLGVPVDGPYKPGRYRD